MNIVFMGTPPFAAEILDHLLAHDHQVSLVVTQPDRPVGRKQTLMPSAVKTLALQKGLPLFQPASLKKMHEPVLAIKPDLIVTAAYGQMLPRALIDEIKAINVHGSLLPKYRGGAPIQHALFDGLEETGITIMHMAPSMDSGDIIRQARVPILPEDDVASLSHRLSVVGARLLHVVIQDLAQGVDIRHPQDEEDVTYAYTIKAEDELLDFTQPTHVLINRLRGLSPEPGGFAFIHGQRIKLYGLEKHDIIEHDAKPGTVIDTRQQLLVKTGDGVIAITRLQISGRRIMDTKDFLNGQTLFRTGDRLTKEGA